MFRSTRGACSMRGEMKNLPTMEMDGSDGCHTSSGPKWLTEYSRKHCDCSATLLALSCPSFNSNVLIGGEFSRGENNGQVAI